MLLVTGTVLVTFGDARQSDSGQHNSVGGDLLVLLSGMCYAAYTVRPLLMSCCFAPQKAPHARAACMRAAL